MARLEFDVEEPLDPGGVYSQNERRARGVATEARVMRIFIGILSGIVFIVVVALLATNTGHHENRDASAAAPTGTIFDSGFNMKQNWGSFSPYFDSGVPFDGIVRKPHGANEQCKLKQVHVLHRHGDRFPTQGLSKKMMHVAKKLQNMPPVPGQDSLAWLANWKYLLGDELLVGSGRGALFESGAKFWGSHGRLLYDESSVKWTPSINLWPNGSSRPKPVLRATTQSRIFESMTAWAAGFFGIPSSSNLEYEALLMDETPGTNNSLAPWFACPNTDKPEKHSDKVLAKKWTNNYLSDAATRLQKMLPDYDQLTPEETVCLQHMCVFETAAFGSSKFCGWFTELEWRGYEYLSDLKFYGESAWGSDVGPATGLTWLTELRARLKNEYITEPKCGVNTTLDSSESTFPLNQPFYADFTHDSVIISVLAALQFPFMKQELPPHKIRVPRQFIVSRLTPFAAHLYVEVLECGQGANTGQYIRLKLNDRVLPLRDLKHCEDSDDGLCSRKAFLKTLDTAMKADYNAVCFGP